MRASLGGSVVGRGSLDRRRPPVGVALAVPGNFDPARLALLRLRNPHVEHALVEFGLDLVGVDPVGQRQRAAELAERALEAEETLLLALVLGLALTRDR